MPDISKVTVERTLTDLVKSGYIAKVGAVHPPVMSVFEKLFSDFHNNIIITLN